MLNTQELQRSNASGHGQRPAQHRANKFTLHIHSRHLECPGAEPHAFWWASLQGGTQKTGMCLRRPREVVRQLTYWDLYLGRDPNNLTQLLAPCTTHCPVTGCSRGGDIQQLILLILQSLQAVLVCIGKQFLHVRIKIPEQLIALGYYYCHLRSCRRRGRGRASAIGDRCLGSRVIGIKIRSDSSGHLENAVTVQYSVHAQAAQGTEADGVAIEHTHREELRREQYLQVRDIWVVQVHRSHKFARAVAHKCRLLQHFFYTRMFVLQLRKISQHLHRKFTRTLF